MLFCWSVSQSSGAVDNLEAFLCCISDLLSLRMQSWTWRPYWELHHSTVHILRAMLRHGDSWKISLIDPQLLVTGSSVLGLLCVEMGPVNGLQRLVTEERLAKIDILL